MSDSLRPDGRRGLSVHGISQASKVEWVPFPSAGRLPDPGMNARLLRCRRSPYGPVARDALQTEDRVVTLAP